MVRSFERRALPPEVVERILANAQRAPSAGFSQGWAFLVLEGDADTRRYWDAVGPDDRDGFQLAGPVQRPAADRVPVEQVGVSGPLRRARQGLDGSVRSPLARPVLGHRHWHGGHADPADRRRRRARVRCSSASHPRRSTRSTRRSASPASLHPIGTVAIGYAKPNDRPSPSLKRGHRPTAEVIH